MSCLTQQPCVVPGVVKVSSHVTMASERILMRANRANRKAYAHHRKSAVELLEESKSSYVKSSKVLNHKQELKHPENLSVSVRETSAVLSSLTHSKSDFELLRSSPEKKQEDIIKDTTSSDEPVRKSKTPPPVPARKPSPTTASKGVEVWNASRRHSPTSATLTVVDSTIVKQSLEPAVPARKPSPTTASKGVEVWNASRRHSPTSATLTEVDSTTVKQSLEPPVPARKPSPTTASKGVEVWNVSRRHSPTSATLTEVDSTTVKQPLEPPVPARKPSPTTASKGVEVWNVSRRHSPTSATLTEVDSTTVKQPLEPPVPARKPSPTTASKGVEVWNVSRRHSPTSLTLTIVDSTTVKQSQETPVSNMSDQDKVRPASFTPSNTNQDHIVKRFSSLSASATMTVSKDAGEKDKDGTERSITSIQSNSKESSSATTTSGSMLKPISYSSLSTSVGVLAEQPRPTVHKMEKMDETSEVPRRRQLHRSHSDLSSCRHSRASSDFSDLSSRLSRTSTEIERFFNEMGLDRTILDPMLRIQDTKRKDFLDNLSSLDSQDARSILSGNELDRIPTESEQDIMERSATGTSVVERNARIIKWLYNVKKARNGPRQHIPSS